MSSSRREFLAGLAAAGVLASVPRSAQAGLAVNRLYPPMNLAMFDTPLHHGDTAIRVGCAAMTWGGKDTQAIEDIASLGYAGIQLRANAVDEFVDPHALRDQLAQHKLTFVALSGGVSSLDPALRQSQIDLYVKQAQFLHEAGGLYLQLISAWMVPGKPFTADDCKLQAQYFNEIGKRISDYGIKLGFHNHMNSIGQDPGPTQAILDESDPNYVKLELDVAHCLQGGGDPVAMIHKYSSRLLFMHFKDVKNSSNKNGYEFVELGQGRVDFPPILAALHQVHYRGWAIVELDREPAASTLTPKESNGMSLRFLREKLGVSA